MPKKLTTTVNFSEQNGQYQLRIPEDLGDDMELKDEEVVFSVASKHSLIMEKADPEEKYKSTYKVNRSKDGTYRVTLPKAFGGGMDLAGKKVEWKVAGKDKLKIIKQDR